MSDNTHILPNNPTTSGPEYHVTYTTPSIFRTVFLFIRFSCIVRSRLHSRLSPHSGQNMSLDRVRHDMRTTDRHTPTNLHRTDVI